MTQLVSDSIPVGSRKSQLALVQTRTVISLLKHLFPQYHYPINEISTTGDHILDQALSKIGEKALFTKELEVALLEGSVRLVVHSLKDLPTTLPENLTIGCILKRESPFDALVMKKGLPFQSIQQLPPGAVIGTSSLRRLAQLRRRFPHLNFKDIRGNLNTRIAKLDAEDSPYSAIILAVAGLERLQWQDRLTQVLNEECFYAVGQGALAVECVSNDHEMLNLLAPLAHTATTLECYCERGFMHKLDGGCQTPIGVSCSWWTFGNSDSGENRKLVDRNEVGDIVQNCKLRLEACVLSVEGKLEVRDKIEGLVTTKEEAWDLGQALGNLFLQNEAKVILNEIQHTRKMNKNESIAYSS